MKRLLPVVLLAGVAAAVVWMARHPAAPVAEAPEAPSAVPVQTAFDPDAPVALEFYRDPAPIAAFAVKDLDGHPISTGALKGKVTIVNYWATWCPPCRAEIPDLIALQAKYGDDLQIVGVSEDDLTPAEVKRFTVEHHFNYPVVMSTPELSKIFMGVAALPTSFILDREGRLVQRHVGMLAPLYTEAETRHLAGLPVNATVTEIDPAEGTKLDLTAANAQVLEIPGVDLSGLSPDQRGAALEKLNSVSCTCGCELSVAKCRVDLQVRRQDPP
jgi:thiol-disulfide isomerase/thioredoxin